MKHYAPDAFDDTILAKGPDGSDPIPVTWTRDGDEPIGRPVRLLKTAKGLIVETKVDDHGRGADLLDFLARRRPRR